MPILFIRKLCNQILVAAITDRGTHDSRSATETAPESRSGRGVPPARVGQCSCGFVHNFDDCHRCLDCEHTRAGLLATSRARIRYLNAAARGVAKPDDFFWQDWAGTADAALGGVPALRGPMAARGH